jgi:putative transposase
MTPVYHKGIPVASYGELQVKFVLLLGLIAHNFMSWAHGGWQGDRQGQIRLGQRQETTEAITERYAIQMEAIGADRDHIHLLCSAHPKVAPGRIVQIFKTITARAIFRKKPTVKRELWGGEFWTDGYYVATVGERANWETVEKYVQKQGYPKVELRQLKLFD